MYFSDSYGQIILNILDILNSCSQLHRGFANIFEQGLRQLHTLLVPPRWASGLSSSEHDRTDIARALEHGTHVYTLPLLLSHWVSGGSGEPPQPLNSCNLPAVEKYYLHTVSTVKTCTYIFIFLHTPSPAYTQYNLLLTTMKHYCQP